MIGGITLSPYERMKESLIREAEAGVYETDDEPIISLFSEGESDKYPVDYVDPDIEEIEDDDEDEEEEY